MQDVNVLVVFYSRMGTTERLALAAAVGAVQGRAFIRLRRLADIAGESTIAAVPDWKENRDRMNKEYVAPREADVAWAEAILAGMPEGAEGLCPEFRQYLGTLHANGKIGAVFTKGESMDSLRDAMAGAGFMMMANAPESDPLSAARLQGRRAAEAVRSRRSSVGTAREDTMPSRM